MPLISQKRYALTVRFGAVEIVVRETDTGLADFERVEGVELFTLENMPEELRKQVEDYKKHFFKDTSEDS